MKAFSLWLNVNEPDPQTIITKLENGRNEQLIVSERDGVFLIHRCALKVSPVVDEHMFDWLCGRGPLEEDYGQVRLLLLTRNEFKHYSSCGNDDDESKEEEEDDDMSYYDGYEYGNRNPVRARIKKREAKMNRVIRICL